MDEVEQDTRGFVQVYGVAQAAGFVAVVLTGVWMGHFRGGFAWASNPAVQFNWHPLLMVLSMVYLYGNGKSEPTIEIKILTLFLSLSFIYNQTTLTDFPI